MEIYIKYIHNSNVLIFDPKCVGGGGGLSKRHFFIEKQFFLISCFLRVFMLFPTFFEDNYFAGAGWL